MASQPVSFISSLLIHGAILAVLWIGYLLLKIEPEPQPAAQSISLSQYIQAQKPVEVIEPKESVKPIEKPKPVKPKPVEKPKEVVKPIAKPEIIKKPEPIPEPEPITEPVVEQPIVQTQIVTIQQSVQPVTQPLQEVVQAPLTDKPVVQAPPVPSGPSAADIKAFGNTMLRPHIEKHKEYPRIAKKKKITGKTTVSFDLHKDGTATNIKVKKSSGSSMLDEAAIAAVQKASASFPSMPANFGDKHPFSITVGFDSN